jgi:DNA invertase Pin-like site-specific DNA recombinase
MQELRSLKIDLFLHQQGLDTTTPAGKMMFQVLGSFAEYERDMIRALLTQALRGPRLRASTVVGRPWRLSWRSASVRHWLSPAVLASG